MNTREYIVDDTIYTLISEEDCEIENNSSYIVRIVYSDVQPAIDAIDFHRMRPNDFRIHKISNLPGGNIYALCENKNQKSRIIVSTGMFDSSANNIATNNNLQQAILLEVAHLRAITQETFDSDITKEDIEDC